MIWENTFVVKQLTIFSVYNIINYNLSNSVINLSCFSHSTVFGTKVQPQSTSDGFSIVYTGSSPDYSHCSVCPSVGFQSR